MAAEDKRRLWERMARVLFLMDNQVYSGLMDLVGEFYKQISMNLALHSSHVLDISNGSRGRFTVGEDEVDGSSELVCIHDSARPLVLSTDVRKMSREKFNLGGVIMMGVEVFGHLRSLEVVDGLEGDVPGVDHSSGREASTKLFEGSKDGWLNGAAVLGVPVKATIKEANKDSFVTRTFDRKTLWEMQTPQVIKPDLLRAGFELVNREGLEVTDDASIVEYLSHPVYITEGSYTNIKGKESHLFHVLGFLLWKTTGSGGQMNEAGRPQDVDVRAPTPKCTTALELKLCIEYFTRDFFAFVFQFALLTKNWCLRTLVPHFESPLIFL
ncbi:hypothetical protein HPP92_003340 [Vanilla planifolia]|uniref:Uncharacterized protein n=1 Tax=Vanilla planifolia TaxID=51239 RepID=A0A835SGG7_VANPL|nr:hypothetical protein HPP92_003340 [Vanilla planifolia]